MHLLKIELIELLTPLQTKALDKCKDAVTELRVLDLTKTEKEGKRCFFQHRQPWQDGIIKTINAIPCIYNDMKKKYGIETMPTTKFNQANNRFQFQLQKLKLRFGSKSIFRGP